MSPTSPARPTRPRRIQLRVVLALITATPVVLAVGLTAWLSIQYGERLVQTMVTDLQLEVAAGAADAIQGTLDPPHLLNQLNADLLDRQLLDPTDRDELQEHLFRYLQQFETAGYVQIGLADGHFVGIERTETGFRVERTDPELRGKDVWDLDERGWRVGDPVTHVPGYKATARPWYQAAIKAGEPTWSEIYQFSSRDQARLGVTAVQPWLDADGNELGVVGTDIVLAQLGHLLASPRLREGGRVFAVERDGVLVAHTHVDPPFTVDDDNNAVRLRADQTDDPITSAAYAALTERKGGLEAVDSALTLTVPHQRDLAFVHAVPFRDGRGVDWVLVVALPRADFTPELRRHSRVTALLCITAGVLAVALGLLVSIRVGRPILDLADAARDLASGRWRPLPDSSMSEIAVLSDAFAWLRDDLRDQREKLARTADEALAAQARAEAASEAKSVFLANMSHELRTPLNAILGYADLIEENGAVYGEAKQDLGRIRKASNHLLALISDILDLSRIEAGHVELAVSRTDATQIAHDAVDATRLMIEGNGNELLLEIPEDPIWLATDAQKARQCLMNLLGNAAKFTKDGTVTLRVSEHADAVIFIVRDTGIGIARDDLSKLFAPFSQVDASPTRTHGGSGLGLAITREYARALAGTIAVDSTLGDGSEFRLTLPKSPPVRRTTTQKPAPRRRPLK